MEKENKDERKRREIIVVGENEFCALRAASGRRIEAVVREESVAEARFFVGGAFRGFPSFAFF